MTTPEVDRVVDAIRQVAGAKCALHEPHFAGNELRYVTQCIETGWVSSVGAFVDRLEMDLAKYTGAPFAVATVNGTSALHVALLLAGVQADDEVIIPALSFVATANAVSYCQATPHFVDVCPSTLGLDAGKLSEHLASVVERTGGQCRNRVTGKRISAIVPMHTFGHPCDLDELSRVAQQYGLPVVEDAAESLGSFANGKHTGTTGLLGVLSFNGNKIVTSGGGGAILCSNADLARRAKHLTTTAKVPHRWEYIHDCVGFNYRMPNLNAALACAQIEQLPNFLRIKRATAIRYQAAFADLQGVEIVDEPNGCQSNFWLNALRLKQPCRTVRDEILAATNSAGLMTRPCWTPLNRLPMYQACVTATLETTDALVDQLINLPSGVGLKGAADS